jgi:23S rRNA (adenine2503-C2)-methyltransferase
VTRKETPKASLVFTDLPLVQVNQLIESLDEPAYRAKQVRKWVYQNLAQSYDEMTDLPLALRDKLKNKIKLHSLKVTKQQISDDGTVKALFGLNDGNTMEAALMYYDTDRGGERHTVCVSTQVGCALGCPFCATGQQGFIRNLTPGEMLDQVLYFARYLHDNAKSGQNRISNVVFMGMGEPLSNYANLWQTIETLNAPDGFGLGARNITISTAGLAPQIKQLAKEKLQVGLAVSLHASDNTLRNKLVPLNRKYPLEELILACREYFRLTGRRFSFEYALFNGVNDSVGQARALAELVKGLNCHVNLIPANPTGDKAFQPPSYQVTLAFEEELKRLHVNVTLRQRRGQAIDAGCGQLRSRFLRQNHGKLVKTGKS